MNLDAPQLKKKGPKACTTCAKAKARCVPGPEDSLKCDRCYRLDKLCLSQTPAPPRVRRSPKLSKIAALEKRLEELSSQVNQDSPGSTISSPKKEPASEPSRKALQWKFGHLFPAKSTTPNVTTQQSLPTPLSTATISVVEPQPWESWWPTLAEAEVVFDNYKSANGGLFPFVRVPEHISAVRLKQDRPFTWKAVMMIGCFLDGARQTKLGEDLLAEVGKAAIVDGLRSLDLLQGLQMLIAWFHYALKGSQVTNLLFLARSMCINLGFKENSTLQGEELTRNLDCMRAYAGTYYLNTLVFTANKRLDVLMNTAFLETCCRVLETTMQHPSDEYLVKLVRIQQLAQSISLTMAVDNLGQHATKLPLTMMVRSFQDQLDQYSGSLGKYADNNALKSHVNVAQVLLYEIAFSDQHSAAPFISFADRLQLLWSCLRSLKSFFDIRFASRELEHPRFLCLSASDFVYAVITGLKLMMLQLPGWNLAHIRVELDMIEVMDQQIRDLVMIITRRKQGIFPETVPFLATVEDPLENLLCRLKTLRDMVKLEFEQLDTGSVDLPAVDANQDLLNDGLASDFWQGFGGPEVWQIVGDPTILDANML